MSLPPAYTSQQPSFPSQPPAYTSQPPPFTNQSQISSTASSRGNPPSYSAELPPNHVTVPHPYPGAVIPNFPRPPHVQAPVYDPVPPPAPQQPTIQSSPQPVPQPQSQALTPAPVISPQYTVRPTPQYAVPQTQATQYAAPYYLINGVPVQPIAPVYNPITYPIHPYSPSSHIPIPQPPRPQAVSPYLPTYPSYQYQPQLPLQHHQTQLMTHQGTVFQEHGYPGPGSLPPGGRWAVTTDGGKRTLWTILAHETRPSGWAW